MLLKRTPLLKVVRSNHLWVKPEGHDTGVKVFNCVSRDKQSLILKNRGAVTWYTCGPTVYDSAHIGHASCYVKLDIIQRILKNYFNLNIINVMNITDIDDKIIARSRELAMSPTQLAKQYENEFWHDLKSLGVVKPNCILRVTDNMRIIQYFILKLVKNGNAYRTDDGSVYFDVKNYERYGKLQNLGEEAEDEALGLKRSSMDFALWKAGKPGEPSWDSPWGAGRPGWHIECSALATHALGSQIDIHAGGIDLRFPHHENEEAQSCAYHGTTQWVNYWLHTGHLHFKGAEKMSKSLKNTITIQEMLRRVPADDFRMACVMSHYRSKIEYSSEFMSTAKSLLKIYKNFVSTCGEYSNGLIKANVDSGPVFNLLVQASQDIRSALSDDFDTPSVIRVLSNVVQTVNAILHAPSDRVEAPSACISGASNLVQHTLELFGIGMQTGSVNVADSNLNDVMDILNEFRQGVRELGISNKDQVLLKLCDGVRDNLKNCGVTIKDHGKKSSWSL